MSFELIARRYASALADVVIERNATEEVRGELAAFSSMFADNPALSGVFSDPSIPHAAKERVLNDLIAKTRPSPTMSNFLRVLLRNSRLTGIADISTAFDAELERRSGIIPAEVVSAAELPASERSELERSLEKLTGKKVKIDYSIDSELIGGVVTRIGSTVYDGSIRTKLDILKEQLVNG